MWRIPPIFLTLSLFTFSIGLLFDHHFVEKHPYHTHLSFSYHNHASLFSEHSHEEEFNVYESGFLENTSNTVVMFSPEVKTNSIDLLCTLPFKNIWIFQDDSFFTIFFEVLTPPPIV